MELFFYNFKWFRKWKGGMWATHWAAIDWVYYDPNEREEFIILEKMLTYKTENYS